MLLRAALFALACNATIAAQVVVVPNTGCGSNGATVFQGSNVIGHAFTLALPLNCTRFGTSTLAAIGLGVQTTSVTVPGCFNPSCVIAVQPDVLALAPTNTTLGVNIPRNLSLIGLCVHAQSACIATFLSAPCVQTDQALQICVQ
jgi:hypothetical protein